MLILGTGDWTVLDRGDEARPSFGFTENGVRVFRRYISLLVFILGVLTGPSAWATEPGAEDATNVELASSDFGVSEQISGEPFEWTHTGSELVEISISTPEGHLLTTLRSRDGARKARMGWRPDVDSRPSILRFGLAELWLPVGEYRVQEVGSEQVLRLVMAEGAGRSIEIELPPEASEVSAWRHDDESGHDGFSWTRGETRGPASLMVGEGRWSAIAKGAAAAEDLEVAGERVRFPRSPPPRPPAPVSSPHAPLLLLFGFGLFSGAVFILWRSRKTPGLGAVIGLGLLMGLVCTWPVWPSPNAYLLHAGSPIRDPDDSVAQLAAMAHSIWDLSDLSDGFAWPDGVSWLTTGPSWLGYFIPAALSPLIGLIAAHNLGILLGVAALVTAVWWLGRVYELSHPASVFAGVSAAFAPVWFDEIDAMSLDRATLFTIPLAIGLTYRALSGVGYSRALIAGAAVAMALYCQTYYGIFLLLALPFMAGIRIRDRAGFIRLGSVLGFALVLSIPPLLHLAGGAAVHDTPSQTETLPAMASTELKTKVHALEQRSDSQLEMESADGRLAAMVSKSVALDHAWAPVDLYSVGRLFWPLALLAVCVARVRTQAALALADVVILTVLSLGPYLKLHGGIGGLMPLGFALHWVPGLDQLKNVQRFALMAAPLATLPLAFGLDRGLGRLDKRTVGPGVAIGLALMLGLIQVSPGEGAGVEPHGPNHSTIRWPKVKAVDLPVALRDIQPGPTLVLPFDHPTDPDVALMSAQLGLSLVNDPPFELVQGHQFHLIEASPYINELIAASGSDRSRKILAIQDDTTTDSARQLGLRYVILYRDLFQEAALVDAAMTVIEREGVLIADDGTVAIWELWPE